MKILIIQTAFIGDVILATPIVEALTQLYPHAGIDFLLRKGNESLLDNNPHIRQVLVWDKKQGKYHNLFSLLKSIRAKHYDVIINLQRFAASGFLTSLSGAKLRIGFDKNPFSFTYTHKAKHEIGNGEHEVERNLQLVYGLQLAISSNYTLQTTNYKPILYPSIKDFESVRQYKTALYICVAPTSVWFTKQYPAEKWVEFIQQIPASYTIYLLGSSSDKGFCATLMEKTNSTNIFNLSGKLSFLQSAALMKDAVMNYVNDSAPMHIASAMNAPTAAVFCSTIPEFGFGPLSSNSHLIETKIALDCRPCGLHGYKACPKGHFKCGFGIETKQLIDLLN